MKLGDVVWFVSLDEQQIPVLIGPAVLGEQWGVLRARCDATGRTMRIHKDSRCVFTDEGDGRRMLAALLDAQSDHYRRLAAICTERATALVMAATSADSANLAATAGEVES
jgi:hypothetical protein